MSFVNTQKHSLQGFKKNRSFDSHTKPSFKITFDKIL